MVSIVAVAVVVVKVAAIVERPGEVDLFRWVRIKVARDLSAFKDIYTKYMTLSWLTTRSI